MKSALPLLLALALGRPLFSETPADPSIHVTGVVLDEQSNAPVARCHLSVRLEAEATEPHRRRATAAPFSTTTDAQGRFAIDMPGPGRWQLTAAANGYRIQFLNEHEGFSSALVLHAGVAPAPLTVHLVRDSSITGVVRDEAGEPIRNANLALHGADPSDTPRGLLRVTTDDRGRFEISGIQPGSYHLSVDATPWYAGGAASQRSDGNQAPARDPVFDVVYPTTWYPGVLDPDAASRITLTGGEALTISFNLLPVPAGHLRVPIATENRPNRGTLVPSVERIGTNAIAGPIPVAVNGGQVDFANLSPGLYRVTTPQPDGQSTTAFLHVAAGADAAMTTNDTADTADVTFHLVGADESFHPEVVLTELVSGTVFSTSTSSPGLRRRFSPLPSHADDHPSASGLHLPVPPGRYTVTLAGETDAYVTSITVKGKNLSDRLLTVPAGPLDVTLGIARGRARITGHITASGEPIEGAMVLLIPTDFGQPGAFEQLRRDQSNTDGSFDLLSVRPGDYILLAIDHGWNVNWRDPATLAGYLVHGVPLTLAPHADITREVVAQRP